MVISVYGEEENCGKTTMALMIASFFYNQAGHKVCVVNSDSKNVLESYLFKNYKQDFELCSVERIQDSKLLPLAANSVADEYDVFSNHYSDDPVTKSVVNALGKNYDTIVIDGYYHDADLKINVVSDNKSKLKIDEKANLVIVNKYDKSSGIKINDAYYYEYYSLIKQYSNASEFYHMFLKKQKATEHFKPIFTAVLNKGARF